MDLYIAYVYYIHRLKKYTYGLSIIAVTLLLPINFGTQQGFAEIYETKDGKLLTESQYVYRMNYCMGLHESTIENVSERKDLCKENVYLGIEPIETKEELLQAIKDFKSGKFWDDPN